MRKEIVVLGAGKIGRGSVGLFFTEAGWQVDFYGHNPQKMAKLAEKGFYETRDDLGQTKRVEGFHVLECEDDHELVEALGRVNVCAIAAYEGAFPSMAASIGRAVQSRSDAGFEEPLNVMLCVNDVHCYETVDAGIRAQLDEKATAYYERNVGLCYVMVMSLGGTPGPDDDPWLVLTSSDPLLTVDADTWHGEQIEVPHTEFAPRGRAMIVRKVFCGNMSHAMRAFVGHAKGMSYMDDGILDDPWSNWINAQAFDEALFAVTGEYEFDPEELEEYRAEQEKEIKPAHDPFTRVGNSPGKKLSYDNRFVWPMRMCAKHGRLPYFLALGCAYGLLFLADSVEGESRPKTREEVQALVERICGLTHEGEGMLRDLVVDSYLAIPETGLMPQGR
ncbi:MAG: hypothetical protein LKG38_05845 [Atopobiaceae bacterium]|jgi:mannitol-1-phosphate 5-dehydrogenase|nr:hypothetical protein [Atopobiaceae bacterium]MCI1318844.1 hypothetical protein [Atopobiaceae bacterium]MCI1389748.1 hypothetical protein [Atopobiaceae bacterium]MCI1432714.1 hypothetical protein [Atopobiaceae bacterium]MCI1470949.1 hypothetical protein [Atopobiaceae bacterium]